MVSDLPDRPAPPQSVVVRARSWAQWVGPGRLVATAVVVLAVLAGGYWLVKPPTATTESRLAYAGTTAATSAAGPSSPATTSTTPTPTAIFVHVAGAVQAPGVYTLVAGARVIDAVQAAGGLAAGSNADAVNLAAAVADGERVYVPRVGEAPAVVPALVGSAGGAELAASGPVDLNTATTGQLEALPGVGPATAAAIIDHRDRQGPFRSVDDLADVRGIGPAKLEALRGLVVV